MTNFKNKNKFLQYELWKDCHIGCNFCCNKGQKDLNKIESLNFVLEKLNDQEVYDYNEVGFIGGEFFNTEIENEEVKKLFYKIFEKLSTMHFSKIYFTTALIFDMNKLLIPFLNYLKSLNILNKCLLCTSYDFKYRFKTEERKKLWENNMLRLNKEYPELKLHTETILTQFFIDAVLNNEFSISEFRKKFNTRVDYIEPASGLYYTDKEDCAKHLPGFFPTRKSFIQFLIKTAIENKELDLKTFCSMELRSSKLYYIDGGKRLIADNRRQTNGAAVPLDKTKKYEIGLIDTNETMIDIANEIYNLIE